MNTDETTPILMEDAQQLHLERRSRVKRIILGLVTATVGVGLCLAIAIPLTLNGNQKAGSVAKVSNLEMMSSMKSSKTVELIAPKRNHSDFPEQKNISEAEPDVLTADNHPWPHYWTKEPNVSTVTTDWEPSIQSCPIVPQSQRGTIELEYIEESVFFELARIQTYNSPAYKDKISCSTVKLNSSNEGLVISVATWNEGALRYRIQKSAVAELRPMESKNDWTINILNPTDISGIKGQFNLLAQRGTYILAYQCYSDPQLNFDSGYVISVYSSRWQHEFNYRIVDSLLNLANHWGLNMNEEDIEYIRQNRCEMFRKPSH